MHVFHDLECLRLRGKGNRCTCHRATTLTPEQYTRHCNPLSDLGYAGHPWDGTRKGQPYDETWLDAQTDALSRERREGVPFEEESPPEEVV